MAQSTFSHALRFLPLAPLFTALSLSPALKAAERPNVILIVTDDQGYGDMACHGNPWLRTPNLDRLASESVRLEDYHVDPYCTPTRAALLTGRYCTRVGAWAVTQGRQLLDPNETTMAQVFLSSGYRTAMFGKWHLGDVYPFAPRHRGFEQVVCHRAGGVDEIGNPAGNNYFNDTFYRNGQPEQFSGYCTDVWFDQAVQFVGDALDKRPFFVYLPTNAMHSPFTAPEAYWRRFSDLGMPDDRAKFFGMIENFDDNLGRLLDALRDLELERDTILIFMGDNGTAVGSNGKPDEEDGYNAGMRGKKGSVYEGGHRVACFVRWPASLKAGLTINQLTSHRDWFPTLVDICRLNGSADIEFDGKSIAPLLRDQKHDWAERTFFIERQADDIRPASLKAGSAGRVPFAVLTEQWRLVNGELYDIARDPSQSRNVAARHPKTVEQLYAAYRDHYADVMSHHGEPTRFPIGEGDCVETSFTVRDWHPTRAGIPAR